MNTYPEIRIPPELFRLLIYLLVSACCLAWAPRLAALSSDREQPIEIRADRASIDDLKGITVYEGNVEVIQGSMVLRGDKVTLTYDQNKQVEQIIAEGNPAYYKQRPDNRDSDVQAEARRMEYYAKKDMLHLIQEARVWQDKDSFSGEHIVYDVKRSQLTAEGGKDRVTVVIEPNTVKQAE